MDGKANVTVSFDAESTLTRVFGHKEVENKDISHFAMVIRSSSVPLFYTSWHFHQMEVFIECLLFSGSGLGSRCIM